MNHNVGGPFDPAYDSSTSSDDENVLVNALMAIEDEEEAIIQAIANNNMMIASYMYDQSQQVIHGGSIPGHIVIVIAQPQIVIYLQITLPKTHDSTKSCSVDVFVCPEVCSSALSLLSRLMTTTSCNELMHLVDRGCRHYRKQQLFFGCSHMVYQLTQLMSTSR